MGLWCQVLKSNSVVVVVQLIKLEKENAAAKAAGVAFRKGDIVEARYSVE